MNQPPEKKPLSKLARRRVQLGMLAYRLLRNSDKHNVPREDSKWAYVAYVQFLIRHRQANRQMRAFLADCMKPNLLDEQDWIEIRSQRRSGQPPAAC